jgi:hypothetical protein
MQATCSNAVMRDYKSFRRDLKVNKAWDVMCHENVSNLHFSFFASCMYSLDTRLVSLKETGIYVHCTRQSA